MIPKMKDNPELANLLIKAREYMDSLTPEQKAEMFKKQAEGWAKSEAQWAKDFREGKCLYD